MTPTLLEGLNKSPNLTWKILELYGDELFLLDKTGTVTTVNSIVCDRYGVDVKKLIGSNIHDYFKDANFKNFEIIFNQVIETNEPTIFTQKVKDRWLMTLIYPFQMGENAENVFAVSNRDISHQIEAEEKLKRNVFKLVTAQENERYRISRDLHDEVGQRMTTLIIGLKTMKEALVKNQIISLDHLESLIQNFESVLRHIRQIFYQLHPPSLDKVELPSVLEGFCSTFEESHPINVDFSYTKDFPTLPEAYTIAIYRFVQEGLTNVAKHSHASAAWITLDFSDDEISIFLEDNGQGFDPKLHREGLGLLGIRERFFPLDGTLEIESRKGKGTHLSGILPFNANRGDGKND